MTGAKKWCVHPVRHMNATKVGCRPSHPVGQYSISAQLARNMQTQYTRSIGTSKIRFNEGDLLCKVCFHNERGRLGSILAEAMDNMEIDDTEHFQPDTNEDTRDTIDVSMHWNSDEHDTEDAASDSEESFSGSDEENLNKATLNRIFGLLGITPIEDV